MYIYLIGYSLLLLGSILWYKTRPTTKSIYIIGFIYISFIAVFRGSIGTDTGTYESIIDNIDIRSFLNQPTEFGFNFLVAFIKIFENSSSIVLRILTAIYLVSLLFIIKKANYNLRIILITYFIPATIFIFSMNTLRVGLALNAIILFCIYLQKNKILSFLFIIIAVSIHISTLIVVPIIYLLNTNLSKKALAFLVFLVFFLISIIFFQEHINNKVILYSDYSSPNAFSGLSNVIVFMSFIPFIFTQKINFNFKLIFFITISSLILLSLFISQFSYAGLRLLQLFTLLTPILYVVSWEKSNINFRLNKKAFWSLLFPSIVSIIFTIRNFISSYGSEYAFIPYSLIF